jgi:hypothetical protein
MKKSQSISRKPKQKKHKNNRERIFLPKESKWEWFIGGLGLFILILICYLRIYSTILGESESQEKLITTLFGVSITLIMSTFLGYTFIKKWAIDIHVKYKNSQKFSLDDIGISLTLLCTVLSVFYLIFLFDWTNWKSYIIHISTVLAISLVRIFSIFFRNIWEKVKTWFTKR